MEDTHGNKKCIQVHEVDIVHAEPTKLLVRVVSALLQCLVVSCHAPDSTKPPEVVAHWWKDLKQLIHQHTNGMPVIMAADTNQQPEALTTLASGGLECPTSKPGKH